MQIQRREFVCSVSLRRGPPSQIASFREVSDMEFDDAEIVFYHACKLGLEGIVSKRKDSTYPSGRSPDWLKMKNPACEAARGGRGLE